MTFVYNLWIQNVWKASKNSITKHSVIQLRCLCHLASIYNDIYICRMKEFFHRTLRRSQTSKCSSYCKSWLNLCQIPVACPIPMANYCISLKYAICNKKNKDYPYVCRLQLCLLIQFLIFIAVPISPSWPRMSGNGGGLPTTLPFLFR